jgi:plastocyanin
VRGFRPTLATAIAFASLAIALPLQAGADVPRTGVGYAHVATPADPQRAEPPAFARLSGQTGPSPTARRLAAATSEPQRATASRTVSVTMGDFFYDPETVSVDPGDTVSWTNVGEAPEGHTVTGDGFDSGVVEEGGEFSHRFDDPGTYDYICSLHDNMTGTVVVRGASGGGGGAGGGGGGTGGGGGAGSGAGGGPAGAGDDGAAVSGAGAGADGGGGGSAGSSTSATSGSGAAGSGGSGGGTGGSGLDGSLAYTGLNLVLLFEIGIGLLASGYFLRRLLAT